VRHVTLVTVRVALQAREPTGDAPVLHQRHAGDDPGGQCYGTWACGKPPPTAYKFCRGAKSINTTQISNA
ncbi:MAG: hypothetical protein V3T55_12545, partial [Anaerolineales bacterium]